MNLFELFIKIGVDDQASKKIANITGKLGNGLKTAAKIGTAAVGVAAAGIAALTSEAVKNYAEYEQLVGGVETLFKNSSNTVMKYAKNAYKTAGMSSSEYMATATSFAASLINSFKDTSSEITEEMAEDMISSLDKQVDAFEEATDAQIKLINKQYMENMKLIDEEEYRRLKAVDDQIAAIEEKEQAEEAAIKKRQQEERKAKLQRVIETAANAESRARAEKNLAKYIQELEEDEQKAARKNQIKELKDQKEEIKNEADLKREALKDQHDYELEAYKEARNKELAYLKEHLKKQEKAIKASIGTTAEAVYLSAEAYEAAAQATDMAISDMADNANRYGTPIEQLRETYASFAKGQWQLLDNLKLGYNGTKSEAERLVADASKLDESVKANDLSFGNFVKAIHAVQVEMEIYGTTAKEAGTTISGSVGMMKAAWTDLITGISDKSADLQERVNNLVTSIVGDGTENNLGVFGNIMPAVETALNGAGELVERLFPEIIKRLPTILKETLPELVQGAMSVVESLIDAISENSNQLSDSIVSAITSILMHAAQNTPKLVGSLISLILALITELGKNLDQILPALIKSEIELYTELAKKTPELTDAIFAIVDGIVGILTSPDGTAKMLMAGVDLVFSLITGIANSIPRVIIGILNIIENIVNTFKETDWGGLGKDIINGILVGLKNSWSSIKEWFTGSWNDLVGSVRNIFGVGDGKINVGGRLLADGSHRAGLNYVPYDGYIAELHKGERVLTANEAKGYGGVSFGTVNINIDGANVQDPSELADMVAERLQEMTERRGAVFA